MSGPHRFGFVSAASTRLMVMRSTVLAMSVVACLHAGRAAAQEPGSVAVSEPAHV